MAKTKPHPLYWKVKAMQLSYAIAQDKARAAAADLERVMREAGLNPDTQYMMNDETETFGEANG